MNLMIRTEAEKIYRAIFKKEIPNVITEWFKRSSTALESTASKGEIQKYKKIIEKNLDLASVEYASRILRCNDMLIKKFRIMVYLGECMPENYDLFINEKKSLIKTLWIIITIPFNSVYKFLKGFLILKLMIK